MAEPGWVQGTGLPWPYSILNPSLPAWYPHMTASIWELLRPAELIPEAHDDAIAGNPVTSCPFGPREAAVRLELAIPTLDALI